jgi:hypothetical protein
MDGWMDVLLVMLKKMNAIIKKSIINSFQAIAPLTAHEKGVHFFGGILPSKIDPKDFY